MDEVEVLVVASKVRAYLKSKEVKVSSELIGALSKKLMAILDEAVARTKGNKRSTVKSQDI